MHLDSGRKSTEKMPHKLNAFPCIARKHNQFTGHKKIENPECGKNQTFFNDLGFNS